MYIWQKKVKRAFSFPNIERSIIFFRHHKRSNISTQKERKLRSKIARLILQGNAIEERRNEKSENHGMEWSRRNQLINSQYYIKLLQGRKRFWIQWSYLTVCCKKTVKYYSRNREMKVRNSICGGLNELNWLAWSWIEWWGDQTNLLADKAKQSITWHFIISRGMVWHDVCGMVWRDMNRVERDVQRPFQNLWKEEWWCVFVWRKIHEEGAVWRNTLKRLRLNCVMVCCCCCCCCCWSRGMWSRIWETKMMTGVGWRYSSWLALR